jgi:MFS family permease
LKRILPTIVVSQFFCTSLWFAGNAVISDIGTSLSLSAGFLAHLTSAVQFGFIAGTFLFALLSIADRFPPSRVFFLCSLIAAAFNLCIIAEGMRAGNILLARFATGFFLAGIYPVGMKIASDYYEKGLGKSLGFLVGALVLGTAFPHLLKSITTKLPWPYVIIATSALCVSGGTAMLLLVPIGPNRRPASGFKPAALLSVFRSRVFRSVAFGYFGHMWELYAFWAFVPVMLNTYNKTHPQASLNTPLLSFLIIGFGSIACAVSGLLSQRYPAKRLATIALALSCICCLSSPILLRTAQPAILIAFLVFWGLVVIADSPLFSSLVANSAAQESRGTSLTIVNCIGFSITIVSIQVLNMLSGSISPYYLFTLLAIGPGLGLIALLRKEYS